jgi:hypothetical protein
LLYLLLIALPSAYNLRLVRIPDRSHFATPFTNRYQVRHRLCFGSPRNPRLAGAASRIRRRPARALPGLALAYPWFGHLKPQRAGSGTVAAESQGAGRRGFAGGLGAGAAQRPATAATNAATSRA